MESQLMDYMELIDKSLDEGYFYSHIGSVTTGDGAEVMFTEKERWRVRNLTSPYGQNGGWLTFSRDDVLAIFNKMTLDLAQFEQELHNKVLIKAVFHATILERIVAVTGQEAFEKAEEQMNNFKRTLAETITKVIEKPKLELV